jgi:HEAT repeat protein
VLCSLEDDEPQVIRAWLAAMTSLRDRAGLRRALDWLEGEMPPGVRRAAGAAAQTLAAAFPEEARRVSVGVQPKGAQAASVCWFVAASNTPILQDAAADRAFVFAAASNPDPHVRAAALAALPRFSQPGALEAVLFALNDEVQEVQLAAIRSLGRMRDAEGRPTGSSYVLDFAASSSDAVLVGEALRSLGSEPEARALQFLLQWANGAVVWKAVAAIEVLGPLAVPERATALQHALGHVEPEVVKAALQVLVADSQRFEPEVILCLRNKHPDVRRLAVEVLSAHPTRDARLALRAQLGVETEAPVSEAVVRSLSRSVPSSSLRSIPPPAEREAE